jgi:hypothetical protein
MKRSEMLKLLESQLEKCAGTEEVLSFLEAHGMAPPEITLMHDAYDRANGTYGFKVHEWEDEDETK